MEHDWIMALFGGAIVGLGGCFFLLVNGRVLGASGILGGLVDGSGKDNWDERLIFILGIAGLPWVAILLGYSAQTNATENIWLLVSGGILTGVGTRIANGCTSGHAIRGISRFSLRSLAATMAYTASALVVVGYLKHSWELF